MTQIHNPSAPFKSKPAPRDERVDVRLSAALKSEIQRAADAEGVTLSQFILTATVAKTRETLERRHYLELSKRDAETFVDALLNPPQPNKALIAARRKSLELFG